MKKYLPLLATLFILSTILLSACGITDTSAKLAGTSWKLVSYGSVEGQISAVEGIDTKLDFGSDGSVSGSMGCNRFSGSYIQKGDSLTFSPIAATEMACPEPQMTQESSAFQVMVETVKFKLKEDTLTIISADGKSKLVLSADEAGL